MTTDFVVEISNWLIIIFVWAVIWGAICLVAVGLLKLFERVFKKK